MSSYMSTYASAYDLSRRAFASPQATSSGTLGRTHYSSEQFSATCASCRHPCLSTTVLAPVSNKHFPHTSMPFTCVRAQMWPPPSPMAAFLAPSGAPKRSTTAFAHQRPMSATLRCARTGRTYGPLVGVHLTPRTPSSPPARGGRKRRPAWPCQSAVSLPCCRGLRLPIRARCLPPTPFHRRSTRPCSR